MATFIAALGVVYCEREFSDQCHIRFGRLENNTFLYTITITRSWSKNRPCILTLSFSACRVRMLKPILRLTDFQLDSQGVVVDGEWLAEMVFKRGKSFNCLIVIFVGCEPEG